jgi:hypothetical protein
MDFNTKHKCIKKEEEIYGYRDYSIVFGGNGGADIRITDSSDQNQSSFCNFGSSYEPPQGLIKGSEEAKKYLAGSYNFKTIDIEVFQVLN